MFTSRAAATLQPLIRAFCLAAVFAAPAAAPAADNLAGERKQFLEAEKALRAGRLTAFHAMTGELREYPLHPYLLHDYIRPRLWKLKDAEISDFLERYGDVPMAADIRRSWLKLLAERGHWQTYLEHYTAQRDETLRCYQLLARLRTGRESYLLEDTRTVWLTGESLPPQCDPAFERLYASELMTPELLWQRIGLAMQAGSTSLARYLGDKLPAGEQPWVARWIAAHHNPSKWTDGPGWDDVPVARRILLHGISRLARQNVDRAISRWHALRPVYDFSEQEIAETDRIVAVRAAIAGHSQAARLLDELRGRAVDEEVFQWRLRTALDASDWDALLRWTAGDVPKDEAMRGAWLYWRGRALEATGDPDAARAVFALLARERNYYGFMGADRAGIPYDMNHRPLPRDAAARARVESMPGIRRARELYLLDMLWSARREWYHALDAMTSYEMQIAARTAADWGWHDRAIMTMGRAEAYDDLELRFPLPYEDALRSYAEKRGLDTGWLFALVRAESAFMEDARSPAGALGLMQVMPETGKETARAIGWRNFTPDKLLQAEVNVPVGTAYLKFMLDRFDRNMVLATAAYNAGPGNVTRWMPGAGCTPPDVWIEQIPFTETRKYVQRILYYSSIYDWRLRRDVVPVQRRLALVQPRGKELVADLGCPVDNISMN